MKLGSFITAAVLVGAGSALGVAPALGAPPVHERALSNGMKVIVQEDHRSPVIATMVWYDVGAVREHSGITGISHVLEHMMFKGTERYPEGRFSEIIAEHGGEENAFTGRDYTAYYQSLEQSRLPISLELEADRMRNLMLPVEAFKHEVEVVKEERRLRTEDSPEGLVYEQLYATAFVNSPYHNPVIGWMADLASLTVDDLKQWYRAWYAPNNATLVVAGDVNPEAVFALAERHFGPLKAEPLPEIKPRQEQPQRGARRALVHAPAQVPYLVVGYHVPSLKTAEHHEEPYALEVLAGILDIGPSARLTRHLVREQQLAARAGAGYDLYAAQESLFLLDGVPTAGHELAKLESALESEIQALKNDLISPEELERVKATVIADEVYERDSLLQQATLLGLLETVGLGWQVKDEYVDKVKAVTPEQVREVARKYLTEQHRTVAILIPEGLPSRPEQATQAGPQPGGAEKL